MKSMILIAAILLLPTFAVADGIYRDKDGKYSGMWRGNDVKREYFDPEGNYLGAAERSGDGWTFRDKKGGYAGSSSGNSDRNPFREGED